MKKRKKQPPINKVRQDAVDKTALLFLLAINDLHKFTDEQLCEIMVTVGRYASHIDSHLVKLKEVKEIIEKSTGMRIKGW